MKLGIAIEETWDFFHEVHAELAAHHAATLYVRPRAELPVVGRRLASWRFRRHFEQFLASQDVVFFEWASELLAAATHLPKRCGIVTRLHRYEMYQWAHRVNWDAVDRVILVSQAKLREFAAAFPAHVHKAVVIPEAVSVTRFRFAERGFAGDIGTLCHMKPRKRVYELVLAFYEVLQQRPAWRLHLGGGRAAAFGEYHEAVTQLVDRLGIQDRVTFYGHVDKPEAWYPRLDVFVSNGYSEGLQVSPMEAMASGCYCFTHEWDGAEELLPEANRFFTNRQLVEGLLRYGDLDADARRAERAGMRALVCERFDVDRTKRQIRALVEDVAASRAGHRR